MEATAFTEVTPGISEISPATAPSQCPQVMPLTWYSVVTAPTWTSAGVSWQEPDGEQQEPVVVVSVFVPVSAVMSFSLSRAYAGVVPQKAAGMP
ncbi:hypothetical protein GCM10010446_47670 [Streptomyces enissocaesilis]|uniref:Uncharacterized protein n=1 Tax=Streptomyces enissocaesilis TaxID=332589 RepID=A0ABP6K0G8_9ACTN